MRLLRKLIRFLLYGGFGGPKPYETGVLAATQRALPKLEAEAFAAQVRLVERMQRNNEDRMVILGFEDKGSVPRLKTAEPSHCLARVAIKGPFGNIPAAVMTHKGILSSLEFKRSPRAIGANEFSVEVRALHASDPSIASAIDKEEHGGVS